MYRGRLITAALVVATSACRVATSPPPLATERAVEAPASRWGLDRSRLDPSVDPCDDFYLHACGGWIAATRVDSERPRIELAEEESASRHATTLHSLLDGTDAPANVEIERLRAFHGSCRASASGSDSTASATLQRWFARIDASSSKAELQDVLVELHAHGVDAFFRYSAQPDRADMRRYRGEIHQGDVDRLSIADIERILLAAGVAAARARSDATQVRQIDDALVAAMIPFGDRFDAALSEHPMAIDELDRHAPHVDWGRYLGAMGYPADRSVNVTSPRYLRAVDDVLRKRSLAGLRGYLRWRLLVSLRAALPIAIARELGHSRSDEACRDATVLALGVELSRQYALATLGPAARDRAADAADRIRGQIARRLADTRWLSESARAATGDKIRRAHLRIGYPDAWPSTGTFAVSPDAYLDNVLAARAFDRRSEWERARSSRNDDSWDMIVYPNVGEGMAAARLVLPNAFPDVFSNSLIVNAARLQRPWFDADAPAEVNYATLGSLIAHETVHIVEFHDVAADGTTRELWTAADVKAHAARRNCVVDEGNSFVAFESTHLDGAATADENVADISGIVFAWRALAETLGAKLDDVGADGLSAAQRFFYAYAHQYCTAETIESARATVLDSHGPPRFRVDVPLANLPAFAEAFECTAGDAMVRAPADRCEVW